MRKSEEFDTVCELETPIDVVRQILVGMSMIAETLGDENQGAVIQRLSWLARDHCEQIAEVYSRLFKMTHPDRRSVS